MGARNAPVLAWATANYAEIMIALAVAAGLVAALYALRALTYRACKKLGPQHPIADVVLDTARRTRWWFMVAAAVQLVQGFVHPPRDLGHTLTVLFTIAAAFQAAIWARALAIGVIELRTGDSEDESRSLASAFGIIRLLVSIVVFTIAGIVVLDNLGVNVTGLVAGLGIGGIAIGLAAQGIFSDLFAALSIIFDKPFQVGDTIVYQGKEGPVTGKVVRIGLKSTRILSVTGELRIIGNTQLLSQEVTNFTGRQLFRYQLPIGVVHQTDPKLLAEIPELLKAEVAKTKHHLVNAVFKTISPSSIDFDFIFEVNTDDGLAAAAAQQQIALGVLRTFREHGIDLAYPAQTAFTAAPDGTLIMPYAPK